MSEVAIALGVSKEVWNAVPNECKQKITKAVVEGQINLAKQMLAKVLGQSNPSSPKEEQLPLELKLVKDMISQAEWSNIFDSGFSLADFAQKAEWRGMIGEQYWTDSMLEMVLARFRQDVASHGIKPEEIDNLLRVLSSKVSVGLNRIRRAFYAIPEFNPTKEKKPQPVPSKEGETK